MPPEASLWAVRTKKYGKELTGSERGVAWTPSSFCPLLLTMSDPNAPHSSLSLTLHLHEDVDHGARRLAIRDEHHGLVANLAAHVPPVLAATLAAAPAIRVALEDLLAAPDLNLDELEETTRQRIEAAQKTLATLVANSLWIDQLRAAIVSCEPNRSVN